jgi:ribosomal protein L11 methylase PrmA
MITNPESFKDKIVLDVGCGTGILSIFAVQAGAKHVYAVDNADIAYYAQEIVNRNGYSSQITVIKDKIENVKLKKPRELLDN